jgi:hypothetical protein
MARIVRTDEEIGSARSRAQKASFDAEDEGSRDEEASAIYDSIQWLFGYSDADPTEEMGQK